MSKEFKTIEEQIDILKSRSLIVNENEAKIIFSKNNYYYLINGYKDLFVNKNNNEEKYKKNVTLNEIYALYEFDSEIRMDFLKYILKIERRIDTYIAYEFSKKYGHYNYLISDNFENTKSNAMNITNLISTINNNMIKQMKNKNKMLNHYMNKYGYVPFWVLIRIMTFGEISKFYSLMKQKDQNAIAKNFNIRENILKSYLENLAIIRNLCAHDEKIYDIRLRKCIGTTEYYKIMGIENTGKKDLFSVIIILKTLLEEKEFKDFYSILIDNIEKLEKNIKSIQFSEILNKMGFPDKYKEMLNI